MENVTTIQLRENTKRALERLKEKSNDSYEEVIIKLLLERDKGRRKQEKLLIESCKAMAEENLKITREFESIEDLSKWEW